jgi:hypothetical protein
MAGSSHLPVTDPADRRRFGRYYTPAPLVSALFRLVGSALDGAGLASRACSLVDPACGAGAFLGASQASAFARLWGLDLDGAALDEARRVAPAATLIQGDAYGDGLAKVCQGLRASGPVVVVGNPPYVANSELLKSARYREVRDALLPFAREVAKGTSVRDDYVLFFGVADRIIEAAGGQGAIAFVTSASFVDNFLYAPLRRWLLSRYRLQALVELGPKMFEGTKVATALSVWLRREGVQAGESFGHLSLAGSREERLKLLQGELHLAPARPHGDALLLNAAPVDAMREIDLMRRAGESIGSIFSVSFPGLKTRFEKLLVDEDGGRLQARMRDFFEAASPEAFAERHAIPDRAKEKLSQAFEARKSTSFSRSAIRPFAHFAGPRHRFRVPREAMAWAYLDPQLIPRGDHRLHGSYDPHATGPKLVFNARELPLVSAVVEGPACVHDWRHARFAPLRAPQRIVAEGLAAAGRNQPLGPPALNLTKGWTEAARLFADPSDLLFYLCGVINSALVQERFAPLVGASEEVPIPRPTAANASAAQQVAQAARKVPAGGALPDDAERLVRALFGVP